MERKTYSVFTQRTNAKTGKKYNNEIGELHQWEEDGYQRMRMNLYMFPDTAFMFKEKVYDHKDTTPIS